MSTRKPSSKLALTRKRNAARRRTVRRQTPHGRLSDDGAYKPENIRRRLHWLAHERQIPAADLPIVKRMPTDALVDFVERQI